MRRFPTKQHFAAHTGTAPLEASSGQVIRHRLSRAGDRKLNHALSLMAIVQIRHPTAGQAYDRHKRAEGKSPKEALRCLNGGCRAPSTVTDEVGPLRKLLLRLRHRLAFGAGIRRTGAHAARSTW